MFCSTKIPKPAPRHWFFRCFNSLNSKTTAMINKTPNTTTTTASNAVDTSIKSIIDQIPNITDQIDNNNIGGNIDEAALCRECGIAMTEKQDSYKIRHIFKWGFLFLFLRGILIYELFSSTCADFT